jgi:hypothetical protein
MLTKDFRGFPQSLLANSWITSQKLGYDHFLSHPFQLIIHSSLFHAMLYNLCHRKSVVKQAINKTKVTDNSAKASHSHRIIVCSTFLLPQASDMGEIHSSVPTTYLFCLFNNALSSNKWWNDKWMMKWKWPEKKQSWPNLRYYPGICVEELGKTTKGPYSEYPVSRPRVAPSTK